jgi:hypothetical protein
MAELAAHALRMLAFDDVGNQDAARAAGIHALGRSNVANQVRRLSSSMDVPFMPIKKSGR